MLNGGLLAAAPPMDAEPKGSGKVTARRLQRKPEFLSAVQSRAWAPPLLGGSKLARLPTRCSTRRDLRATRSLAGSHVQKSELL